VVDVIETFETDRPYDILPGAALNAEIVRKGIEEMDCGIQYFKWAIRT
jgi:hypothetical protein